MKTCDSYPDSISLDDSWKAARAFSILAFIFGFITLVINLAAACARPDNAKAVIGPGYTLTCIFQGLNLLFINSNACKNNTLVKELNDPSSPMKDIYFQDACSISTGAKFIIAAVVLYFVASILSCVARAEEKEEERPQEGQGDSLTDPFLVTQKSIFFRR